MENSTSNRTSKGLFRILNAPQFPSKTELATFAAGCFWGVEDNFRNTKGVMATAVGFMGGHTLNPTYKQVCYEKTGHAEVVQIEFDPTAISYPELLDIFWNLHDPTTLNRQGPDVGDQYRSAIFYHSPEQKSAALRSREALEQSGKLGEFKNRIVTELSPASAFYPAEDSHQQYAEKFQK